MSNEPTPNVKKIVGLDAGHYWVRHPEGSRFVVLYQPPCWYCAGVKNAITFDPEMIIGPVMTPDAADQFGPLSETCIKLSSTILTIDAAVSPWLKIALDDEKVHPKMKADIETYMNAVNEAFVGTIIEIADTKQMMDMAADGLKVGLVDGGGLGK